MSVRAKPFLFALVIVVVAALGVAVGRSWGQHGASTTSTSTSTSTSVPVTPADAIWPFTSSASRFTDPVTASFSFARDYLGFAEPTVSTVSGSVNATAKVSLRPSAGGRVTTVMLVRSATGGTWWVVGASTPTIVVSAPAPDAVVTSPVTLSGRSTAYEGVINVDVRQAGSLTSLARVNVMGGGMGTMGPFQASVHFAAPTQSSGVVMLRERSAKDGSYVAATVVRVKFS